jgi:hypothetical protein
MYFFFLLCVRDEDSLQVCFEVVIAEHLPVDFGEEHQEANPHLVRVGWSLDSTSFQLGIHATLLSDAQADTHSTHCRHPSTIDLALGPFLLPDDLFVPLNIQLNYCPRNEKRS